MNNNPNSPTKLTVTELAQFVDRRGDIKLNAKSVREAQTQIEEAINDLTFYSIYGYEKIDDPGHGYLVVPFTDRYVEYARECESSFSRMYRTQKAFLLEEDCDATKFLKYVKEHCTCGRPSMSGGNGAYGRTCETCASS
jgi:hypothetical protein